MPNYKVLFFVLLLQTSRPCWNAPSSRGGREQSIFHERLALITTSLVSTSWMTLMELDSKTLNTSKIEMLSKSTQRSSRSGRWGKERNQWPGKHWLRSYVILNFVLLEVRLKKLNWTQLCQLHYELKWWYNVTQDNLEGKNLLTHFFTMYHKPTHFLYV